MDFSNGIKTYSFESRHIWRVLTIIFISMIMSFGVKNYVCADVTNAYNDDKNSTGALLSTINTNKNVLFISSYSYDWPSVPGQLSGISKGLNETASIKYYFMDTKNISIDMAKHNLDKALDNYSENNIKFDLIIVGDDTALDYCMEYKDKYFNGIPVVFEGINDIQKAETAHANGDFTGVTESFPITDTIKLARKIYPKAKKIIGISDTTASGIGSTKQFMATQGDFKELEYSVINTDEYYSDKLSEKISDIKNDGSTILVYLICSNDKSGRVYTLRQAVKMVSAAANVPVFRSDEAGIGDGLFGGKVISFSKMGYKAGVIAKKILDGDKTDNIDIEKVNEYYCFDQNIIDKYKISKDILPSDSKYINYIPTFTEKYKLQVYSIMLIFTVIILFLLIILVDNIRRRALVNELKDTQSQLNATIEGLDTAVNDVGIFFWKYDIDNDIAYPGKRMMEIMSLEDRIDNFTEIVRVSKIVNEQSVTAMMKMHHKLIAGDKHAEVDAIIKTGFLTGSEECWYRVRYTVADETDINGQRMAFATAENIDIFKKKEEEFAITSIQNGVMTWTFDIKAGKIYSNETSANYFGLPIELDNVPEAFKSVEQIHPDDRIKVYDSCMEVLNGTEKVISESRWKVGDSKEYRWLRISYTNIYDKNRNVERAIGSSIDITESMLEKHRYQEQMSYKDILLNSSDLFVHMNLSRNCFYSSYCKYYDDFGENIKDKSNLYELINEFLSLIYENDRDKVKESFMIKNLSDMYSNGNYYMDIVHRLYTKNKNSEPHWFKTAVHIIKNPENNEMEAFIKSKDVDSDVIRKNVFESLAVNDYGYIAYINLKSGIFHRICTMKYEHQIPPEYPIPYEEVYDNLINNYVSENDRQMVAENMKLEKIVEAVRKNTVFTTYLNFKPEYNADIVRRKKIQCAFIDEDENYIYMIRSDITEAFNEEQKKNLRLAKALDDAQKASKAKSEFLSRISHEIRTPLNGIKGSLMLLESGEENKKKEYLHNANISVQHLSGLVNDVLDMSKIESGKLEINNSYCNLNDMIEYINAIIRPQAEKKHINFSIDMKPNPYTGILIDEMRFKQVCINLLSNSVKYTNNGGNVSLNFEFSFPERNLYNKDKEMWLNKHGDIECEDISIFVAVSDNGIGMSKEFLDKAFEPFSQADKSFQSTGTGLGLSITKNLLKLMGTDLRVESEPGKGTTSKVLIITKAVIKGNSNLAKVYDDKELKKMFAGMKVLVAEDNYINTVVAEGMLNAMGIVTDTAADGLEAVQKFGESKENEYKVIFMDIMMPNMDGYAATKEIRSMKRKDAKTVKIAAMTANAFDSDVNMSHQNDMDYHLSKPFEKDKIIDVLIKCL